MSSPLALIRPLPFVLTSALALTLLPSCKRLGERMEITETREISSLATPPQANIPSRVRFFDNETASESSSQIPLVWDTPSGWKGAPPDSSSMAGMRLINLSFGPKDEGECYLSAMQGDGGGLKANINRWRTQMGLPEMTDEELAKLPVKTFLGRDATFVSFDGDFKAMGATEGKAGYRMLGLIQSAPEFTLFVKMTGPKDLVIANEAAFDQFSQSIAVRR